MRPPPLLLGVTLLFWGWQVQLPWAGALLGLGVEAAHLVKFRWDLSDEEFERIWTLCSLLLLATVLYAFTANEGLTTFGALVEDVNFQTQRQATLSTARTAANLLRWLPMVFFPFLIAQTYSTRETIPLATISHLLQRRWKLAKRTGAQLTAGRGFNIGYPYLCMALLSASFHPANDNSYFWGFSGLLLWTLWGLRSRRYRPAVWAALVLAVVTAGYFGQRGVGQMQRYLESFNAQWLVRFMRRPEDPFQSRTAMGRIGQIKLSDRIVIRLTPQTPGPAPEYLREASFRRYERQVWYAGSSRDDFQSTSEDPPGSGRWVLVPHKLAPQTVKIACYLEGYQDGLASGLLPLPSGVAWLDHCPAYSMKMNTAGAVLAQGPGLLLFDAHYGPGATHDAPPGTNLRRLAARAAAETNGPVDLAASEDNSGRAPEWRWDINEDLHVPEREKPALEMIIAELDLRAVTDAEKLRRIQQFFAERFTYSLWQPGPQIRDRDRTILSRFLQQTRSGHCEYFATATVLLLRQLDIPARYATGYSVSETAGKEYVVRLSDAHAWTLVWDRERERWFDFDTTPASWRELDRNRNASWRWLTDAWAWLKFEFAKFTSGQSKLRQYLVWAILPGLLLLLYQILFRRQRQRKARKTDREFFANWPGLDSDFYQLEARLARRGVTRGPAEPLQEWLQRAVQQPELAPLRATLEELLRLHYRHRFDPQGLSPTERESLRQLAIRCLRDLETSSGAEPVVKT